MTVCIVHVVESNRNPDSCPDCEIERLKVRLQAYDKALSEIQSATSWSIDGNEFTHPINSHEQCVEVARLALSMDPEEFIKFMQEPPAMTKKHATYYTDSDTRQSLIDIGMKAGAKEGRAASLGLRISAAYHDRLVEALREASNIMDMSDPEYVNARDLLAEIEEAGK